MKNPKLPNKRFLLKVYPIILILLIPVLLVVNTLWSLKSFNRDANFIVRHQAVGIAESVKPFLSEGLDENIVGVETLIRNIQNSSEDVLDITVLKDTGSTFDLVTSTNRGVYDGARIETLANLSRGGESSYAGLSYNPIYGKTVWNVIVPVETKQKIRYAIHFSMDTASVTQIISRTTKDSLTILVILVIISFLLLANHFYFYLRALKTQQLEELDKMKDEFISIAAHELRAPVTAFNGYLDLLKSETEKNGIFVNIQKNYDMLIRIGSDLNTLIDDLLNVSRIEQGRLKTEIGNTDISKVVSEVVDTSKAVAEEKGLQINLETKNQIPPIQSDAQRLRQVVTNLVSNSIKYTLQGSVNVSVFVEGKNLKIVVKDTGIGIPPEELKKLFQKFHRVQDKQTNQVRGTGLGLWITKEIVELLGGKIDIESIYGTGTSATVTFPMHKESAEASLEH